MILLTVFVFLLLICIYRLSSICIAHVENKKIFLNRSSLFQLENLKKVLRDIDFMIEWCYKNSYPSKKKSETLKNNWNKIVFSEITKGTSKTIASVIGKNVLFQICIDRIDENENVFKFVVIHELAHMASEIYGHGDEFVNDFRSLLNIAEKLNIYTPISVPTKYCDFDITSTP